MSDDDPTQDLDSSLTKPQDATENDLTTALEHPCGRSQAANPVASEASGTVIGPYKLLQQVGEGGFGVVYMAEQSAPVKRRVALKIIKLGMDTKQVVARFEVERQALAMMDHPNIAKVYDAGSTENGRPYFVMELVRGMPITQLCEEQKLDTAARLALFMDVCAAIQHAHQKGIIHRDLKPSNVIVTLHDDKAVPKVIDFGIAKATQHDLTDMTLFTQFEQFVGTPAYMSPEQAQMSGLDIDTRSDIYSLGVLLYELLTGTTPFNSKTLLKAGYDEMRRVIREEEPPKPSTRLTERQKRTLSSTEVRVSNMAFDQDLDWIVMKALEKDRKRCYETASSLAADIQRHVNNEPVSAVAPSALYRLRKYARRNRGVLLTTTIIATVLVIGAVVSTWMAIEKGRANAALQNANEALAQGQKALEREGVRKQEALDAVKLAYRASAFRQVDETPLADSPALAIAQLARFVRDEPNDHASAERLVNALTKREFASPVFEPIPDMDRAWFSDDGQRILTTGFPGKTAQVWDLSGNSLATLTSENRVAGAEFSRDGSHVLTHNDAESGVIQIWDWKQETCVRTISVPGRIRYAHFSPGGDKVLSSVGFGPPGIWDANSGDLLLRLDFGVDVENWRADWSEDGQRVTTGNRRDGTAQLWDASSGDRVGLPMTLDGGGSVIDIDFSPDGRRLVTASGRGSAQVWDADMGEAVGNPLYHKGYIADIEFSHDGSLVVTASIDGTARVWLAETGEPLSDPLRHRGLVARATFHPDGNCLITASEGGSVQLWHIGSGRPIGPALSHRGYMTHVSFSPDGQWVLTAATDPKFTQLWRLPNAGPGPRTFRMPGDRLPRGMVSMVPSPLVLDHRGERLATVPDRAAVVWDVLSGKPVQEFPAAFASIWAAISGDGRRMIITSPVDGFKVVDTNSGKTLSAPESLNHKTVLYAEFSPDREGKWVLAPAIGEHEARVWNTVTGNAESPPLKHDEPVLSAKFNGDGALVVTTSADGIAKIWDAVTWDCLHILPAVPGDGAEVADSELRYVYMARFSPDSSLLVTAAGDGAAMVWEVATGEQVIPPLRHAAKVGYAEFSPDGKWLVTASADGTARVWNAADGKPQSAPMVHEGEVMRARFSPDGGRILTASTDHSARIWDARTGDPLSEPLQHDGQVRNAIWHPSGTQVVTAGIDFPIRLWDVPPAPRRPVPEWVPEWAESVVGLRLDAEGAVHKLSWNEANVIRANVRLAPDDDHYKRIATWFYQDPKTRTISPFSKLRREDYVANRIHEDNVESLEEALLLDPGNPEALSAIATLLKESSSADPQRLRRADYYARQAQQASNPSNEK